ncbi:MAG: two-component system, chemotaxis family, protein-glutamate methylesterase/glutaminase, partial [Verrucomicrobiota bacterium]
SALKKFAPRHRTHVVESFAEAEAAARQTRPQLFVVDFDPPRPDAIEFLDRISSTNPDARFLAIASGVPSELSSQRSGPNAIHFVEKPFELVEFGAAIQALLGPWTDPASGDSRGTLRDLNVRDLVPLQCVNLATAVLHLRSGKDRKGEIHFFDGQMTHASTGNFSGPGALHQMMRWKNPRATETESLVDSPRSIHGSWQHVFLEALRQTSDLPAEPTAEEIEPVAGKPQAPAKSGKKIVVIDDTEMLLIFVEDALATADPGLQIVTAFTGSEGARRAEVMIPDLVLLDYSLPDLRGDQVCERLLQNEATARIPIVMMSGHVSEMMATARNYRNVVATIAKPFMSEALVTLVREALARGPLPAAAPALPPAPSRQGNGEKPAKKNGAAESASKEAVEKQAAPIPIPAPPPAPVPQPSAPTAPPSAPVAPPLAPVAPPLAPVAPPLAPLTPPPVLSTPSQASSPPVHEPPRPPAAAFLSTAPPAGLAASNGSSVVLGLGMEVISVQFTPRFQIGTIRAKPTASTLSLTHQSGSAAAENLLAGFEIGPVELDGRGLIRTMRVVPTHRPANSIQTRNGFEINDVALINESASIELTARGAAPMTMRLVALFKVAGVELSDRFEVAQLLLQPAGSNVRITLDPQSSSPGGPEFETAQVRLDASSRIVEFVLRAKAK